MSHQTLHNPWRRFAPATVKYRERNLDAWVRQPANAWSNLAYVIVGMWLWTQPSARQSSILALIPITAILVGIGSFLYHASFSLVFQVVDLGAMYLFSCLFIAFNLWRLFSLSAPVFYGLYLGLFIISLVAFLRLRGRSGFLIFIVHVLIVVVLEALNGWLGQGTADYAPFIWMLATLAVAWGIWILDYKGLLFDPDNHLVQGHALWHVISSFCFILAYRYYSSFIFKP